MPIHSRVTIVSQDPDDPDQRITLLHSEAKYDNSDDVDDSLSSESMMLQDSDSVDQPADMPSGQQVTDASGDDGHILKAIPVVAKSAERAAKLLEAKSQQNDSHAYDETSEIEIREGYSKIVTRLRLKQGHGASVVDAINAATDLVDAHARFNHPNAPDAGTYDRLDHANACSVDDRIRLIKARTDADISLGQLRIRRAEAYAAQTRANLAQARGRRGQARAAHGRMMVRSIGVGVASLFLGASVMAAGYLAGLGI